MALSTLAHTYKPEHFVVRNTSYMHTPYEWSNSKITLGFPETIHTALWGKMRRILLPREYFVEELVIPEECRRKIFIGHLPISWVDTYGIEFVSQAVYYICREVFGVNVINIGYIPSSENARERQNGVPRHLRSAPRWGGSVHVECHVDDVNRLLSYTKNILIDGQTIWKAESLEQFNILRSHCTWMKFLQRNCCETSGEKPTFSAQPMTVEYAKSSLFAAQNQLTTGNQY